MDKFFSKLRIGEKIGIGFAVVGLLFVGVVWQDHQTLQSVLGDYQQLQSFELRKSLALEIEIELAAVRDAEKRFLIEHQQEDAEATEQRVQTLLGKVSALAAVDHDSQQTADALQGLVSSYQTNFAAVANAWRVMGLNEDSGLQGAFRDKVHRLQALAAGYNVDRLYTLLLQIRRSEKDLALRQDPAYGERVRQLLAELRQLVETSELQSTVKQQLLVDLTTYARTFEPYAERALKSGNIDGGKGPFRDAAHHIEATLNAYRVANLEASVLQLRRREKDFLLRGDESYPPMVVDIAEKIRSQIAASAIAAADKTLLIDLLQAYERDFLALVAQSSSITTLTREMNAAADRVAPLVKQNVDQANQMMVSRVAEINASSQESAHGSLIVMSGAIALAIVLALAITARIVGPVRQMAGLLDSLAYGRPSSRVPTYSAGRDEINSMGESLNALVDHRTTFLLWWKESMDELSARRELLRASSDEEKDEALQDLRRATIAKLQQLKAIRGRLLRHGERVLEVSQRLQSASGSVTAEDLKALEHAAEGIAVLLDVLTREETPANAGAAATDAALTTTNG